MKARGPSVKGKAPGASGQPASAAAAGVARVAVVEDDPEFGDYLLELLRLAGYDVSVFATPGRFFDYLLKGRPDVVLMDMHLPGMDGKEIIRVLRANPETRGLFLIAMSGEQRKTADIISGLHSGADEYLVKPFDADLLLVRLQALLRRGRDASPPEEVVRVGEIALWPDRRMCRLDDADVPLTRLEFDLLAYFVRQANRVLTRSVLLESVWRGDPSMTTRTVDKHVESLRRKLGAFGRRIETVVRVGYVLKSP